MAVRSGAGTGVVVSLVVFILTTIFLLILTIVFYSGQSKALEDKAVADATLKKYIEASQRNNDTFKAYETSASQATQSVAMYLHGQIQGIMGYVHGSPDVSLSSLKSDFAALGIDESSTVRDALRTQLNAARNRQAELDRLNEQLQERDDTISQAQAQMDQMREANDTQLAEVQGLVDDYRESIDIMRAEIDEAIALAKESYDRQAAQDASRITQLENQADDLYQENVQLKDRVGTLTEMVQRERLTRDDPSLLVDGTVIDSDADEVFIDRGKRHHIVQGMTFEVFPDENSLKQVDRITGAMPRGKASLQVIRVGDTTSTCKVLRSVPGRPVVRGDVIANAVYDPDYEFKFLIHGRFDVDGDGRPSESEAEYLRSLVIKWGGTVVAGESLPGNLDFLVLGEQPIQPMALPDNVTELELRQHMRRREMYDTYQRLKTEAMAAQIPVLNANRFFILIGN